MAGFYLLGTLPTALQRLGLFGAASPPMSPKAQVTAVFLGIPVAIGCIAAQARLWFVVPILAEGRTAFEAVSESWNLIRGSSGRILGLQTLGSLVAGIGFCACYVGGIFTFPILFLATAAALEDMRAEKL